MTTLNVLSAGAAKGLVLAIEESFSAAASARLECSFGAVGAIREKLLAGEPCDVVILTAALIDTLAAEGRIDPATRAPLGRVYTGIAVPDRQEVPDVSTTDALCDALLGARAVYLPDPDRSTAGIHFVHVLEELGIYGEVQPRLRPFPNGAMAMRAMADEVEYGAIGCTQVTEIRYTAGVMLAGLLPPEFELATTYSVAVASAASDPALARRLAALLAGPESLELRRKGGFVVD